MSGPRITPRVAVREGWRREGGGEQKRAPRHESTWWREQPGFREIKTDEIFSETGYKYLAALVWSKNRPSGRVPPHRQGGGGAGVTKKIRIDGGGAIGWKRVPEAALEGTTLLSALFYFHRWMG